MSADTRIISGIQQNLQTEPSPSLPELSRRKFVVRTITIGGVILGLDAVGNVLSVLTPGSLSQESETANNKAIILTPEQLQRGVNLVVFGDSIPEGFQGYTYENGNRITNPPTSFADLMNESVENAGIGHFNVDVRAQPGATGEDIYKQVVEYHNQITEAKRQGTFVNRPTIFVFSMNGNSYREILSNPEIYAQAETVDRQGFINPELLNLIPPFQQISQDDMRFTLQCFEEMTLMAHEGFNIAGLQVLGPYDFGGIPSMEFIPMQSENPHGGNNPVPITVFNLSKDENARKGAHLVSLSTNKSILQALALFYQAGNIPFPVNFTSMVGLEQNNNGTEHLNIYGCWKLACLVLKNIRLQLSFRSVSLFYAAHPIPPLPEIKGGSIPNKTN